MHEGLSHNFVDDIFRDSYGYIWISTSGSLARYDGYEFVNFNPNTISRYIKSTFVRKVAEDSFRRLWVANDGGLDVIDLRNLMPVNPGGDNKDFEQISVIPTDYVSVGNDGNIWLRNSRDVICLELDERGNVERVVKIPHNTVATITTGAIKPIEGIDDGVLTGIGGKVCVVSLDKDMLKVRELSEELTFETDTYIADFVNMGNGIWIATDLGLYRYDLANGSVKVYHGVPGVEGVLSQNFVTSLAVGSNGNLIAGCLNGLNVYDQEKDGFLHMRASDLNESVQGLGNDFVNCLLAEGDNLWVGTEGCGINLFTPRRLYATLLRHDSFDPTSLSPNPVNAIYEDGEGTVWVGTVEGGLNRAASGYGSGFSHFTLENGALTHNSVSAITSDHTGHLWVGTWGGGVNMMNRTDPSHRLLTINSTPDGKQRLDYIGALAYDPFNNAVWVGANSGIYLYEINSGELTVPFENADKMKGSVTAAITPDGKLWMGGLEGVFCIDLKSRQPSGKFQYLHIANKLDNPESSVKEKVTAIAITHDGTVWIGSNGNGIYRLDNSDSNILFVNYNSSDGLPNDVVHGIAEDPHGNLWIATYHGLSCMTPEGNFLNFGLNNGLDTEQFYWNAYQRLANGDILFGSVDGMVAVSGLATSPIECGFPVRFTSLTVNGECAYGTGERCQIPENERSFEVGFSALDYAGISGGRYLYRMNGYETEWKELEVGRHSVAYMNLSPGNYTLEVKYVAAGQSVESAPVSRFEMEIVPNFYKRWWFIILLAVAVLVGVWGIYSWRVRDLTRQRNQLKKAVDDGIKEICGQKSLIEEHARELSEQNKELTLRNEQINEQKSRLSEMAREIQKLTADRISFFTNITHEFRTPITLIIGPVERALKLSTNPKVIEQLNFVERNSRYLLSLINQLMDFRKIESGKMEPITRQGNIRTLIDDIVIPFRAYTEERHIEIRTIHRLSNPVFNFNEDAIRKVLTNLLGNAIKFTPDNGRVTVYAAIFKSERCGDGNTFYLCVSDTGCGIDEDETDKVFDHFYQGSSQIKYPIIGASDSGIGLYLCRRLVEVYGGTIKARNNHGAGCSFRVLLKVSDTEMAPVVEDGGGIPSLLPSENTDDNEGASRLTLLMVEDNEDMRGFMRSVLSDNYNVVEAENGEEAMKVLLSRDVDFIISDLMMPVMDGLELASKVKENFSISHIPFIMLTAKTSQEARMEGYRNGVDDYILKPFDEDMLLTRIDNILTNKRRYQRQFVKEMEVDKLNITEDSRDKKFVEKVMEVVRNNYTNSYFDVAAFTEELGISRSLLNKKLQSLMGQSAIQLVRNYRLNLAKEIILRNRGTHNMNVSEVAFEVGFNDSKYFTRCFTKHFGISPSTLFRGENQEGNPGENQEGSKE